MKMTLKVTLLFSSLFFILSLNMAAKAETYSITQTPKQWPSDIPKLLNLDDIGGTVSESAKRINIELWGKTDILGDEYYQQYAAKLKEHGFTTIRFSKEFDMNRGAFEKDNYYINFGSTIVNPRSKKQFTEISIY